MALILFQGVIGYLKKSSGILLIYIFFCGMSTIGLFGYGIFLVLLTEIEGIESVPSWIWGLITIGSSILTLISMHLALHDRAKIINVNIG